MLKTQERETYERLLKEFRIKIPDGELIYDIGKSVKWDYKPLFKDYKYKTVDIDPKVKPDIEADLEGGYVLALLEQPFGILCNGVTEQCNNPFQIISNLSALVKPEGVVLFGVCLTGYPLYSEDYFRFTLEGILKTLDRKGFNVVKKEVVKRVDPSYVYCFCKRK